MLAESAATSVMMPSLFDADDDPVPPPPRALDRAPRPPGFRVEVGDGYYMAYWTGFKQGVRGDAASRSGINPDPLVVEYYMDGHRLGSIARPRKHVTPGDPAKVARIRGNRPARTEEGGTQ